MLSPARLVSTCLVIDREPDMTVMSRGWFAHIALSRWAEPALSHGKDRVFDVDAPEIPEGKDVFVGMSQVSTSISPPTPGDDSQKKRTNRQFRAGRHGRIMI